MHQKLLQLTAIGIILSTLLTTACRTTRNEGGKPEEDGPREMLERDIMMMKDPALGYVPTERLLVAKEYKDRMMAMRTDAPIAGINWKEQGPNNQGGRSRAVMIDPNDGTGNTVWAGSVGGGLWKTTNITAASPNWTPVNDLAENLAISSLAYDPSNTQTMYFTTGEGYGNLDGIRGLGVWQTTNGGTTWAQLPGTNNSNFYYCQKIAVTATGVILVATNTGLRRSADGGVNWTKVLGSGMGITGANSNFCYDVDIAANGDIYATLFGSVHKSTNGGLTFAAAQTLPVAAGRVEIACAPNDAQYVYAVIESSNVVSGILRSTDGGTTWTSRTEPNDADPGIPDTDFSRGQAWYDLCVAVDPNNRDRLFTGGIDLFVSNDGAGTWAQVSHWYGGFGFQNVHADQHHIIFANGSSSIAYFVNDGGIYRSANANAATPTITDKGTNYRTAQFYACAIHPTAQTAYFLGGTQDNGSHQFNAEGIQPTVEVTGGDGAFCHIDQDQPQFQFTSYVYNDFYRSSDGGASWTNVATSGGDFISPTDYDDAANILYMCNTNNSYRRWDNAQTGATFTAITGITALNGLVSAVKVSPNTANRVFFGSQTGRVVRVDNANGATPTATNISTGLPAAFVSCVEVETGNDNHLLVTFSNYGVTSIYESTNGGTSWTAVEGNLPDMPVRWALFNPNNNDQAVIATELGVWSTDNLNGATTNWGASNSGLANVRVDMLQLRQSDKYMIAATHGRGMFGSDAFTSPTARFYADKFVSYQNGPVQFTSNSYRATSWLWDFGDGTTSTLESPVKNYTAPGRYTVTLTINGGASTLAKTQYIQVLPNRGTPYTVATGGGFEINPDDFGPDNQRGTAWQRGNSAVAGKNGVRSGANAWVTGLVGAYLNNTSADLWSPNYNFTLPGTYTLSFWAKFNVETNYDGIRVQYTLDRGATWTNLGTVGAGWYNFANTADITAYPFGEPFLTGSQANYTNYTQNVSFLAGSTSVGFRIQFKSDVSATAPGVAIEDFEITGPVNAVLPVRLLSFGAQRTGADVQALWQTENESGIDRYEVQRSTNGSSFTPAGSVQARNTARNDYGFTDMISQLNPRLSGVVYYRLKIVDRNGQISYSNIARVNLNGDNGITVGPNPFTTFVNIYTPEPVKRVMVYNAAGAEIFRTAAISGNRVQLPAGLPAGNYTIQIETASGLTTRRLLKQ